MEPGPSLNLLRICPLNLLAFPRPFQHLFPYYEKTSISQKEFRAYIPVLTCMCVCIGVRGLDLF